MPGSKSVQLAIATLDHITGHAPMPQPPGLWLALSTTDPGEDGSGLTEIGDSAYLRQQVAMGPAAEDAPGSGVVVTRNIAEILFPPAASSYVAPVSHFVIFDATTGGMPLFVGSFSAPTTIPAGQQFQMGIGDLAMFEE